MKKNIKKPIMQYLNLGTLQITPTLNHYYKNHEAIQRFCGECLIAKHALSDWGEVDEHRKALNDTATDAQGRILSAYNFPEEITSELDLPDSRLWIITYPGKCTQMMFSCEN